MLWETKEERRGGMAMPHGVLFRGGGEQEIPDEATGRGARSRR
ncbi:SAM-dependent methyltransferase [Streptomyces sp. NBC_00012]